MSRHARQSRTSRKVRHALQAQHSIPPDSNTAAVIVVHRMTSLLPHVSLVRPLNANHYLENKNLSINTYETPYWAY